MKPDEPSPLGAERPSVGMGWARPSDNAYLLDRAGWAHGHSELL